LLIFSFSHLSQSYRLSHSWKLRKALHLYSALPSSVPRFSEPAARAMPPLIGVGERYAPRATWSCIDEPLKSPSRSRSASLPTPIKGRTWRHRLLRAAGMSTIAAPPPRLKLPRMLDEPVGLLPLLGPVNCLSQVHSMEAEALCVEVVRF
jgi:hypothetical protein